MLILGCPFPSTTTITRLRFPILRPFIQRRRDGCSPNVATFALWTRSRISGLSLNNKNVDFTGQQGLSESSSHTTQLVGKIRTIASAASELTKPPKPNGEDDTSTFQRLETNQIKGPSLAAQLEAMIKNLRSLVDIYNETEPAKPTIASSLPKATQTRKTIGAISINAAQPFDPAIKRIHHCLREMLQRSTNHTPWSTVYETYLQLPEPRPNHIPEGLLRGIVSYLAASNPDLIEHQNHDLVNAYLHIMDDMLSSNLYISRSAWDTAIHLSLKPSLIIRETDFTNAIRTWRRMEKQHKTKGNHITLTILYLAAAKTGHFNMATHLWKELQRRGPIDYMAYSARIYALGRQRDRAGILRTYVAMLESGNIIDIDVLNLVIGGLVVSGEVAAGLEVLARIKARCGPRGAITPSRRMVDWREKRRVRKLLRLGPRLPVETRLAVQRLVQEHMVPNERTYLPLIKYYAVVDGDFARVMGLLVEMAQADIKLTTAVWNLLFRGFGEHGNDDGEWNQRRLLELWDVYADTMLAPMEEAGEVFIPGLLPVSVVGAFAKLGMRDQAEENWRRLSKNAKIPTVTYDMVHRIIG
ncbi:hypothetical protein BT63DRAFT_475255 [Microthyrium microscopicum]|uniref:Pentatricopeptide repeat protein n=1 Tax=Microthyrium microscopicum TaxID=703497 RepID=A0A6A6ULT0_9PEZI|nr:hypothetical protein BT63DRAFT_475255 [Microthyrium microscopicum]